MYTDIVRIGRMSRAYLTSGSEDQIGKSRKQLPYFFLFLSDSRNCLFSLLLLTIFRLLLRDIQVSRFTLGVSFPCSIVVHADIVFLKRETFLHIKYLSSFLTIELDVC